MNPLLQMVFIYLGVLLLLLFVINILTKGFLFKYLRAKIGKRKGAVLLMVDAKYFNYLVLGKLREGWLTYKDRDKAIRRLSVSKDYKKECAQDFLGVVWLEIDEEKNCILKKDYSAVSGYDAVHNEELMLRCLNRSKLNDYKKTLQIILVILIFVGLFSIANLVMLSQAKKTILLQLQFCDLRTLGNVTMQTAENVITGGNLV